MDTSFLPAPETIILSKSAPVMVNFTHNYQLLRWSNMPRVKPLLLTLLIIPVLAACNQTAQTEYPAPTPSTAELPSGPDPLNSTYIIENTPVTLNDGKAEMAAAPGSATKIITSTWGEPIAGELTSDALIDAAVMLTQQPGGSGTFFYIAASLQNPDGTYTGTNAILLGDRISPQTTEIINQQIIVNFADRAEAEDFTTQPSIGISRYFKVTDETLVEIPNPVVIDVGNPLSCTLLNPPKTIEGTEVTYGCEAPGAYLASIDMVKMVAQYLTTNSQGTAITYGPEVVPIIQSP